LQQALGELDGIREAVSAQAEQRVYDVGVETKEVQGDAPVVIEIADASPQPPQPPLPGMEDLGGSALAYAEQALLALRFQFTEGGALFRILLSMLVVLLQYLVVARLIEVLHDPSYYYDVLVEHTWRGLVVSLLNPGMFIHSSWPLTLVWFMIRDIISARRGDPERLGIPVRHVYSTRPGSVIRVGTIRDADEAPLRAKDLRPHAVSVANIKLLNSLNAQVTYTMYYLHFIPIRSVVLDVSGEILVQILHGKNLVASTDLKSTAMRMETFANSLMVVNMNRYEAMNGVQRIPDTVRVAYAAYRQYLEKRMFVPFPYHPLRS
jgi:hypothetical protein